MPATDGALDLPINGIMEHNFGFNFKSKYNLGHDRVVWDRVSAIRVIDFGTINPPSMHGEFRTQP